eukprot:jgi/Hompol1/3673/HPOL_006676-RA
MLFSAVLSALAAVSSVAAAASDISPVHLDLQKRLVASQRQACFVSWRVAHPANTTSTALPTPTGNATTATTATFSNINSATVVRPSPTVVRPPPPPPPPRPPPPPQGATAFGIACLNLHNQIRARYGRAPFTYSVAAQNSAAWWASYPWDPNHPHNSQGFGQNVLSGAHNDGCATAMNYWFNGEISGAINGRTIGQILEQAGHLTQVLDRHSMQVGCASIAKTVCNYWPPGNFMNEVWHW